MICFGKITGNNYDKHIKEAILSDDNATIYWLYVKGLRVLSKLSHYIYNNTLMYKTISFPNLQVKELSLGEVK